MAYSPISNTVPKYESGQTLKAYIAGTSTLLQMATASDGLTLVNYVVCNASGYPAVSGNVVIPHINAAYKLSLYPTEAAAIANSGAIWMVDNLTPSSIQSNLDISANTISSTNTNGDITLDPNGAGEINLNATTNITTADIQNLSLGGVSLTSSVSGFVSGTRPYIKTDPSTTGGFDVVSNVTENTFESVGPTGSSADNIWTAMDDIPSSARIAIVHCVTTVVTDGTDRSSSVSAYARMTGASQAVNEAQVIGRCTFPNDDYTATGGSSSHRAHVPLDSSRRFDVTWLATNDTSRGVSLYLIGFII